MRLPATLEALYGQITSETDVIVVDDGSTDLTSSIAESFGTRVIRHEKNRGYGGARQTALENCQTDILAFIDDECYISNDWFAILTHDWTNMDPEIVALAGPMLLQDNGFMSSFLIRNNPFSPIRSSNDDSRGFLNRLSQYFWPNFDMKSGFIESAANGNLSFRKIHLERVGGYNITLKSGGEDSDVCRRLLNEFGTRSIWFDSQLRITQKSFNGIGSILRRGYRYGTTAALGWRDSGGVPTFLPIPAFLLASTVSTSILLSYRVSLLLLLLFFVFINFPHIRRNHFSLTSILLDPFLRLAIELFHNIGFIRSLIREWNNRRSMSGFFSKFESNSK